MPVRYELTWIATRKRWRKRYAGRTYYLKTETNGKRDREGYKAALHEWQRLRDFIDGVGPDPYGPTGRLLPAYASPVAVAPKPQPVAVAVQPQPSSPLIIGHGFHPELQLRSADLGVYSGERSIHALAEAWHTQRKRAADRGELSLRQWADDKAKLQVFRNFLLANFPDAKSIDQIDARILNLYREKQWEFVDDSKGGSAISKATLKKRLDCVSKWLTWLVDQNVLTESPKDLQTYGRIRLDRSQPLFWTVEELRKLDYAATRRTSLYIRLALNLGYTQKDIATLTASMVDWETGIVTRDREKTGVPSRSILWRSNLALLRAESTLRGSGPLLLAENGSPLYVEKVNANGKLVVNDSIRMAFDRVKARKSVGLKGGKRSFKHLRKSAANEIEKRDPSLTSLFLAHSEKATKRHYVSQHFESLFEAVKELESHFFSN